MGPKSSYYIDVLVNQCVAWRLYIPYDTLTPIFHTYSINPNDVLITQLYQLTSKIRSSPRWIHILDAYPVPPFSITEATFYPHLPRLLIDAADYIMERSNDIPYDWIRDIPFSNAYVALLCGSDPSSVGPVDWRHLLYLAGRYGVTFTSDITAKQLTEFFTTQTVYQDLEQSGLHGDLVDENWFPANECQFYAQIMQHIFGPGPGPESVLGPQTFDSLLSPFEHLPDADAIRRQILERVTGPDPENALYQINQMVNRLV